MKETQTNDESIMNSKQPTATNGQVDAVVGKINAEVVDRYNLGDSIRKAYLKYGDNSWCSIADDVIADIKSNFSA